MTNEAADDGHSSHDSPTVPETIPKVELWETNEGITGVGVEVKICVTAGVKDGVTVVVSLIDG